MLKERLGKQKFIINFHLKFVLCFREFDELMIEKQNELKTYHLQLQNLRKYIDEVTVSLLEEKKNTSPFLIQIYLA